MLPAAFCTVGSNPDFSGGKVPQHPFEMNEPSEPSQRLPAGSQPSPRQVSGRGVGLCRIYEIRAGLLCV